MLFFFSKPTPECMRRFLETECDRPFTYPEVGRTRSTDPVPGFDNDLNRIELGRGDAVWAAAKAAVRQWHMFPGGWTFVFPDAQPIREGIVVAMAARVLGIWWLNSCRIVYTLDEPNRFGFAYGTLPGHIECGEELFLVEKTDDGRVWYTLRAFSRPRFWAARLGYPLARRYQRKFVRESLQSMLGHVHKSLPR